ncbi:putative dehydrogenase [Natranaerovirga pectinivora]|uniref:Putative dehydrogenase n=1 Tax=Natranaerovirga pectinivora TaxID=682400 RepID=A0A4R3MUU4_9FIRM|nr:Gfo/Idh/MocA family oxidoreductase [Natranaerovirga pectinivora]TCT17076.1 putative dehydrogenase [Natranaerovirga pectinivora]
MNSKKIIFGIIGSGWRAECFLNVAKACPDRFEVCGVVTRSEENKIKIGNKWNVNVYHTIEELLEEHKPEFVITAVAKKAGTEVILDLTSKNIPVLAETPPGNTIEDLIRLHNNINVNSKIQIAEQYHLQPIHASRISLIDAKTIGPVQYCEVSISQGYHSISLMRKYLGIQFENATIRAYRFKNPVIEGPGRSGPPNKDNLVENEHTIAILDFDGKVGCHNFENNQHRSWVRSQNVVIRGTKGEIKNTRVSYLKDYLTPIEFELKRKSAGEFENLEGYYFKGIIGEGEWLYKNEFMPSRMSDEEIALGTTIIKMSEYVKTGQSFYSLAEACQDQYLSLMIEEAIEKDITVKTKYQKWARL